MKRLSSFLVYLSIGCLSLLLFLLVFESQVRVPAWLQIVGRMHPLFLHFPIVLLVFSSISLFFSPDIFRENTYLKTFGEWGLLLAAASSCITALMGFLLSRETGYDTESLFWHKWSGIIVSAGSLLIYFFRQVLATHRVWQIGSSVSVLVLIIFTGHQGSGITHGQNFLLAPMLPEKPQRSVSWEEALVYTDLVQPILEEKCMTCHNRKKAKGELVMETTEALLTGGKNGKLWDLGEKDLGLLLRRIHLPIEEKKHMPPQGKPQLSEDEQIILYHWIKAGSSFTQKLSSLPLEDTLRGIAERLLTTSAETASYDFEPAAESEIRKLTTDHRVIHSLSLHSPALGVNFYNQDQFSANDLEELAPLKEQIVELDLSRMPVEDQHLALIASFRHLQKLHLNFTRVTGATFTVLQNLKQLHQLSLAGTPLVAGSLSSLKNLTGLRKVILWNTPLSEQQLTAIRQQNSSIAFETGVRTDTVLLPLTPPILLNEEQVLLQPVPLKMKHYVSGVNIRYTTDGSEPDSLTSALYQGGTTIGGNTLLKARAFKKGWIGSTVVEQYFYKSTYQPDTAYFIQKPDAKYLPFGTSILYNRIKGELSNFSGGQWLGFRENNMEVLFHFATEISLQQLAVSCLVQPGSYIMPPVRVEVWGGNGAGPLRLLGKALPKRLDKMEGSSNLPVEVGFRPTKLSVVKVVVVPLNPLPTWHPGKGEKGWAFVDEVFFN